MKSTDRLILVVLPVLAVAIGFWLLVLGPKSKEAGEMQDRIDAARASLSASEAQVVTGEAARKAFPENYSEVVSLGTAVPEDDDQASLIYDLAELGSQNSVRFRSFRIGEAVAETATPPPVTAVAPSAEEPVPAEAAPVAAVPTEASAAALPIGATVGPAGLPVTPYDFKFMGDFFDMADFFAAIDAGVATPADVSDPNVSGRLLTIDGFAFSGDPFNGFPSVEANFAVTTYIVPPGQGIAAGATPAGPAPPGSPDAPVPVSTDPAAPVSAAATVAP